MTTLTSRKSIAKFSAKNLTPFQIQMKDRVKRYLDLDPSYSCFEDRIIRMIAHLSDAVSYIALSTDEYSNDLDGSVNFLLDLQSCLMKCKDQKSTDPIVTELLKTESDFLKGLKTIAAIAYEVGVTSKGNKTADHIKDVLGPLWIHHSFLNIDFSIEEGGLNEKR